jgi:hypothetical protein
VAVVVVAQQLVEPHRMAVVLLEQRELLIQEAAVVEAGHLLAATAAPVWSSSKSPTHTLPHSLAA